MPRTVLMSVLNALTPMFIPEKQSARVCEVLSVPPDASFGDEGQRRRLRPNLWSYL